MILTSNHMHDMERSFQKVDYYNKISLQSFGKSINSFNIYRHETDVKIIIKRAER